MARIVEINFDGEPTECFVEERGDQDTICHAKDGRFVKFPSGIDLDAAIAAHNEANAKKPLLAEEAEAQASELEAWKSS